MKATGHPIAELGLDSIVPFAEVSGDCVAITELDGRILYMNRAGIELIGMGETPEHVVGRPLADFVTDRGLAVLKETRPIVIRDGFWRGESELGNVAAGEAIPVELDRFLIPHPDSHEPCAFLTIQRDIRSRKRRDHALSRWAAVIASSNDAIYTLDREGIVTSWNDAAERIYGYPASEAIGRPITFLKPPRKVGEPGAVLAAMLAGRPVAQYETECVRTDGREIVVAVTPSPVRVRDEEPREVSVIARDVTEEKRAQERLRRLAGYQTVVARVAREAVAQHDLDVLGERARGALEVALDAVSVRLLGFPSGSVAGGNPDFSVAIEAGDRDYGSLEVVCGGEEKACGDDLEFVESVASVLASAAERGLAERRIEQLAETRRGLVAQALDAEERERRVLAVALHDQVLQLLLAAGQDLDEAFERGVCGEPVEHARTALQMAVTELRATMANLHPAVLEHGGLAAAIRSVGADAARRGGFEFESDVEPAGDRATDGLALSTARELIVNAARHSRARHVTCSIRRSGDEIVVTVTDDGIGIAPRRVENAVGEGHLGLASLRERVEAAGGSFTLESAARTGTTAVAAVPAPAAAPLSA